MFAADPEIAHWSFYVGQGAVRFYLPLDAQLANDYFAQAVVVTKGYEQRQAVQQRLEVAFAKGFDDVLARVSPLEQGPPVGWPLKFRLGGPDVERARSLAHDFARMLGGDPDVRNINFDWNEQIESRPHRSRPGPRPQPRHLLAAARLRRSTRRCRAPR